MVAPSKLLFPVDMALPVFQVKAVFSLLLASNRPAILFAANSELVGQGGAAGECEQACRHIWTLNRRHSESFPGKIMFAKLTTIQFSQISPSLDPPPDGERTIQDNRYFASEMVGDGKKEVSPTLVLDRTIQGGTLMREAD